MDIDLLKQRYTGQTANLYEENRNMSEKWAREQQAVKKFLEIALSSEDPKTVLDVPVGTGRFFDIYGQLPVDVTGYDVSEDMLEIAFSKAKQYENINLVERDLFKLNVGELSTDIVVCIRFANWVEFSDLDAVLEKLLSISRNYVIIGVRTVSGRSGEKTTPDSDTGNMSLSTILTRNWNRLRKGVRLLREGGISLLLNALSDFVNSGPEPDLIIHNEEQIKEAFQSYGYRVKVRELIDTGPGESEYFIYLLNHDDDVY